MISPTFIGQLLAEIIERGLTREELARKLGVKPPSVSGLKNGKGSLDDSKLSILAELHGGCTENHIKAVKYLDWLEREKGLTLKDLEEGQRIKDARSREKKIVT